MTPNKRAREWAVRLRQARVRAQLTRSALAELMGVDPSAVSHWERGAARPRDLERFAKVCGVEVGRLYAPPRKAAEG